MSAPRRPRVYLAGPLSAPGDPARRLANVQRVVAVGLELLQSGYAPLMPHLSTFVDGGDECGYENWLAADLAWIEAADVVLRLPGPSAGTEREVTHAALCGVPVVGSVAELQDLTEGWEMQSEGRYCEAIQVIGVLVGWMKSTYAANHMDPAELDSWVKRGEELLAIQDGEPRAEWSAVSR